MPRGSKPGERRGGRHKGTPNKMTAALRDAIFHAFDTVGGEAFLVRVAEADPRTFCSLLGRVLPLTVAGEAGAPIRIQRIERVVVDVTRLPDAELARGIMPKTEFSDALKRGRRWAGASGEK